MGRERGSVAPRSHAFRSVMAAAQTLLVRSRRVHMHTPRRRAPAGRPAGLVALVALAERGEKERPRKTERKRRGRARARSPLCAHGVFIGYSGTRVPREYRDPAIIRATRLIPRAGTRSRRGRSRNVSIKFTECLPFDYYFV